MCKASGSLIVQVCSVARVSRLLTRPITPTSPSTRSSRPNPNPDPNPDPNPNPTPNPNQPFYVVILDLTDEQTEDVPTDALGRRPSVYDDATRDEEAGADQKGTSGGIGGGGSGGSSDGVGRWKWSWPEELSAWKVNSFSKLPAPLYLPEDALTHETDDSRAISHPELSKLFDGFSTTPHHGREYRPSPRLRLWQQKRTKEEQTVRRKQVFSELKSIGSIGSTRSNN